MPGEGAASLKWGAPLAPRWIPGQAAENKKRDSASPRRPVLLCLFVLLNRAVEIPLKLFVVFSFLFFHDYERGHCGRNGGNGGNDGNQHTKFMFFHSGNTPKYINTMFLIL